MMFRMRPQTLLVSAVAVLASLTWACAGGATLPEVADGDAGEYRLDSGDELRIIVFGQEQLTGTYWVDGSGSISVPLIPTVSVRALTTEEIETKIAQELARGVVIDPSVSVQVETFRPFFILGEVRRPGKYPFVHRMNVLTAVAIAGGFGPRANEGDFSILRSTGNAAEEARGERNTRVQPGDVIFVRERFF